MAHEGGEEVAAAVHSDHFDGVGHHQRGAGLADDGHILERCGWGGGGVAAGRKGGGCGAGEKGEEKGGSGGSRGSTGVQGGQGEEGLGTEATKAEAARREKRETVFRNSYRIQ